MHKPGLVAIVAAERGVPECQCGEPRPVAHDREGQISTGMIYIEPIDTMSTAEEVESPFARPEQSTECQENNYFHET